MTLEEQHARELEALGRILMAAERQLEICELRLKRAILDCDDALSVRLEANIALSLAQGEPYDV